MGTADSLNQSQSHGHNHGHEHNVREANQASLTAYGAEIDGVRIPHKQTHNKIRAAETSRQQREHNLQTTLTPGATIPNNAGNRQQAEQPDPWRTCFEIDLDRIKHSPAFRKLGGKCQVHVAPRNETLRNRLTHAIEVTQVAVAIARRLNLNTTLTSAIALGHDCGHGPGGHASEDAFSPYIDGGYDHAVWGADRTLARLNLTSEVSDGIRNHSWRRPAPATPEAEIVSIADRVAYVCHDYDDAVNAGIIQPNQLPEHVTEVVGTTQGQQLGTFIDSVCAAALSTGRIGLRPDEADALDAYRQFNYKHIYTRPASTKQARRVIGLLSGIIEYYIDAPNLIAVEGQPVTEPGSTEAAEQAVTHASNLTDRGMLALGVELLGWDPHALPRGV